MRKPLFDNELSVDAEEHKREQTEREKAGRRPSVVRALLDRV